MAPGDADWIRPQKLDIERDLPMTGQDLLRARLALARNSDMHGAAQGDPDATTASGCVRHARDVPRA